MVAGEFLVVELEQRVRILAGVSRCRPRARVGAVARADKELVDGEVGVRWEGDAELAVTGFAIAVLPVVGHRDGGEFAGGLGRDPVVEGRVQCAPLVVFQLGGDGDRVARTRHRGGMFDRGDQRGNVLLGGGVGGTRARRAVAGRPVLSALVAEPRIDQLERGAAAIV